MPSRALRSPRSVASALAPAPTGRRHVPVAKFGSRSFPYAGDVTAISDSLEQGFPDHPGPATPGPGAKAEWHPGSWQERPAAQQPPWPDPTLHAEVLSELGSLPPLVFAGEAREAHTGSGRCRLRTRIFAPGGRLCRILRRLLGRRDPGQAEGHLADGANASEDSWEESCPSLISFPGLELPDEIINLRKILFWTRLDPLETRESTRQTVKGCPPPACAYANR